MADDEEVLDRPQRFIFSSASDAADFVRDVTSGMYDPGGQRASHGGTFLPLSRVHRSLQDHGGVRSPFSKFHRSWEQKETRVYGYQEQIHQDDVTYLEARDPTANMLINQVPDDTWLGLPDTRNEALDEYFAKLMSLGYLEHTRRADKWQRRDIEGAAFVVWHTDAPLSRPINANQELQGFDSIRASHVKQVDTATRRTPVNSQHGILRAVVKTDDGEQAIHGTRLDLHREHNIGTMDDDDPDWLGRTKLSPIYDDLWNLRDVVFGQTRSQFEGNPIFVEFMPEAIRQGLDPDEEGREQLDQELAEFVSGSRQIISPVGGITLERVGEADLPDATQAIRLLASRIAQPIEFTVNHILATSRGSEQIRDADLNIYQAEIDSRRTSYAVPVLRRAVNVGKIVGEVGDGDNLITSDLDWPDIRTMNLREKALAYRSFSLAMDIALQHGRGLPKEIADSFPASDDVGEDALSASDVAGDDTRRPASSRADSISHMRLDELEVQMQEIRDMVERVLNQSGGNANPQGGSGGKPD